MMYSEEMIRSTYVRLMSYYKDEVSAGNAWRQAYYMGAITYMEDILMMPAADRYRF